MRMSAISNAASPIKATAASQRTREPLARVPVPRSVVSRRSGSLAEGNNGATNLAIAVAPHMASAQEQSSLNDRHMIERRRAEYVDAFNREDVQTMTEYVAAEIDSMAPGRPAIRDIDGQIEYWKHGFAAAKSLLFIVPDDLELLGDVAIDRHRWVLDSLPKHGGGPVHEEGKGIWIWRRQVDGSWKVTRSIWNSDLSRGTSLSGLAADVSEDLAAIRQLLGDFVGTVNAGDPQACGGLMTEDVIFALPDLPPFAGKQAAIAAAKAGLFAPSVLRLVSKYDDVQIFSSHAFAHVSFVLDRIPKAGGNTVTIRGKCTSVLRKQSDGWKYALIIFSYDHPAI